MKRRGPEDPPDDAPLFSGPPHNERPTSKAAAAHMLPKAGTQRRKVYDAILWRGTEGLTREEICIFTRLPAKSVDPRVWELLGNPVKDQRAPLIRVAPFTRRTKSGEQAEVLTVL